ncbi:HNH endonuclease, partial [Burkholderia sp. S171]|uniref:HNH endonuclease n=1 Tax=Burkholderia sp. S171 TaxID=1641860 RepID=UPI001C201D37
MAIIPVHFERIERFWLAPVYKTKITAGVTLYGYNWTHSNFDWLKELLKKRLRKRQSDRCCYCRRALVFDRGHVELDHIIDKGSQSGIYARFTFEPRNLALACKDCNNNKGTKKVLTKPLATNSPYLRHPKAFLCKRPLVLP